MTEEKLNEYSMMINSNAISIEMLLNCIANLEPLISKSAYKMKKYRNSYLDFGDDPDSHENRFNKYISYRNMIMKVLNNPSLEEIRDVIKGYKKSDIVSDQMRDKIIELIRNGDFILVK